MFSIEEVEAIEDDAEQRFHDIADLLPFILVLGIIIGVALGWVAWAYLPVHSDHSLA